MKTMFKYFAKKYVLSSVNDFLTSMKEKQNILQYKNKIVRIIKFLNNLCDYLDDNELTEDESEKIIEETKALFD